MLKHIQQMVPLAFLIGMASNSMAVSVQPATVAKAPQVTNPYSPQYGHPYRHGAIPTRQAHAGMMAFAKSASLVHGAPPAQPQLAYNGGVNGIGVTSGTPKVYLVVYGSQWGTQSTDASGNLTFSGDSLGAVPYLQKMFKGLGTGNELWSGVMTQYCDGPLVTTGAKTCPSGAPHVGYPTGGAFAGIWYDNSVASPASATGNQLANEAIRAAAHFGNTTAASNRYAQYVILSPSGTTPDGFNTASGNFCAWHDYNGDTSLSGGAASSPYGDIAFTNMPYVADAGSGCGQGFVNSGTAGQLDGFSIVEGHEYAETITDQNPAGGWTNPTDGEENGDECAWISSGQGASANVVMGTGTFAMQSTWSNDTNRCDISHAIVTGGTTPPPTVTPLTNNVPVTGQSLATGGQKVYSFAVPSGATSASFQTSGGTGDVDIYVQLGTQPTTTSYLQKSDGATTAETITLTNPTAGTYYLLTNGYSAPSGFQVLASYSTGSGGNVLSNGVPVSGLALTTGNSKVYTITVPAGRPSLTIKTTGGTGDADIYAKLGSAPTTSSYLAKSDGSTTVETITISTPAAGTYYILLNAYATFSGVTLTASY